MNYQTKSNLRWRLGAPISSDLCKIVTKYTIEYWVARRF